MPSVRRSVRIPAFLLFVNTFFSFFSGFFLGCQPDRITGILIHSMHKICHPYTCLRSFFYQQEQNRNDEAEEQAANPGRALHPPLQGKGVGKEEPAPARASRSRGSTACLRSFKENTDWARTEQEPASRLSRARSENTQRAMMTDSTRWKVPSMPIPFTIIKKGVSMRAVSRARSCQADKLKGGKHQTEGGRPP